MSASASTFARGVAHLAAPTTSGRARGRAGAVVTRADGGGGIGSTSGIPYLIARKAGFDTSEGIAGFTPFAELFIGRTAMGGFATGLAQELLTGDGILAQVGQRDTPNEEMFAMMMAFLAGTTIAGVWVTFRQLTTGAMSNSQYKRYQSFLGVSGADEAALNDAEATGREDEVDGALLAREFAAVSAAVDADPGETMDMDPTTATMTAKQVEDGSMVYLKSVELNNARWAMVGFAVAVVMEAKTGGGIGDQLIMYGKMSGLLGVDSGF
mmetsp:Transcript_12877/g.31277  ORF Transcript_12877/g.31277 Transcript_12877/m.31277 type:complete len:268 (-) Transcript_12877:305-1108(-)